MNEHICNLRSAWPIGHPLPPEDPAKLTGPEVGDLVVYNDPTYSRWHGMVMTVTARSYVWSPGECRSKGGHRLYSDSVVFDGKGTMVVSDEKLVVLAVGTYVPTLPPVES